MSFCDRRRSRRSGGQLVNMDRDRDG